MTRNVWPTLAVAAVAARDRTTFGAAPGDRYRATARHSGPGPHRRDSWPDRRDGWPGRDNRPDPRDSGPDRRDSAPDRRDSAPDRDDPACVVLNHVGRDCCRHRCDGRVNPSRHRGAGRGSMPATRSERAIVSHRNSNRRCDPGRNRELPRTDPALRDRPLLPQGEAPGGSARRLGQCPAAWPTKAATSRASLPVTSWAGITP
jgi:hypothetical protein